MKKFWKILKQYKLICPKHEKPFRYFCNDCKVHECKECRKENLSMKKCIHINYIDFAQKEYDIKNQIKEINEKIESSNICDKSLNESDFNLKNNVFYLKNLSGDAFKGKVSGNVLCNVLKGDTSVLMNGDNMDAVSAIDASAGISNALSGKLSFSADLKLNAFAPSFNDLLKSVKGPASFTVTDGHYMNIGTIDKFVLAGNVSSNAVMKAALLPIKNMPVVQSSSNFSKISGKVTMADGIATLVPVKSQGKSLSYFLTGKYNVINGYTNVIILGRMGADLVAVMGPLGQLSVSKLASFLPS